MTTRLDAALAARKLARSRTHAAALIADGRVVVDGAVVAKASTRVEETADIRVTGADSYVSRAAHKLVAALDRFGIDVTGRVALDMGASTGGFTQVLLERGAAPVMAVDVGHDQLAASVRADERVRVVEGFNARYMTRASLAAASGVAELPGIVTGDLSFISLRHVLPAVAEVASAQADVVLLVKPQFEVGRHGIREGIVVDPERRIAAVAGVIAEAAVHGLGTRGVLPSPVAGAHGNREVLLHLAQGERGDDDWSEAIVRAAG